MRTALIAEVSSNHGGRMYLARAFVHDYAKAGADWVKFQAYQTAFLHADDPQAEWLKQAELSDAQLLELREACKDEGVRFLCSVFDVERIARLRSAGITTFKVGAADSHRVELANALDGCDVFVSFWSTDRGPWTSRPHVPLLTRSAYPCPLSVVPTSLPAGTWGWSDHCEWITVAQAMIAQGAVVVEKHVSLPKQARAWRPFEASVAQFTRLARWRDDLAHRGTETWDASEAQRQFVGRWG